MALNHAESVVRHLWIHMHIFEIRTNAGVFQASFEYNMKNDLEEYKDRAWTMTTGEISYIICADKREILSTLGSSTALFVCWMLYICQADRPPRCLIVLICFFAEDPSSRCDTNFATQSYQFILRLFRIILHVEISLHLKTIYNKWKLFAVSILMFRFYFIIYFILLN